MDFDDEFQLESDLMFCWDYSSDQSTTLDTSSSSDDDNGGRKRPHCDNQPSKELLMRLKKSNNNIPKVGQRRGVRKVISSSAPVNIPTRKNNPFRYGIDNEDEDDMDCSELFDEEDYSSSDEDQMMMMRMRMPPHLIVEKRVSGEMARSFSPLKGRNLYEVRDSILRMTGFLER